MKTLKDFNFKNKKVLLRAGFDVPIKNNKILDDRRILATIETISYLLKKNAKIIIISHNGRPKGKVVPKLRMDIVAKKLEKLLEKKITKLDECLGKNVERKINSMKSKDIILLENLRFYKGEKSKNKKARDNFGKQLASLADIFVNDSFATAHRNHASMTSIPKYIPSCIGLTMEKEIKIITNALKSPKKLCVAIIGGVKADKINAIKNLVKKVDIVLLGGGLGFFFQKKLGYNIPIKIDLEGIDLPKKLLNNSKIELPIDGRIDKSIPIKNLKKFPLDIGDDTIKLFKIYLENAKTILWAGPLGAYEDKKYEKGTKEIAKFISKLKATIIIGGGDTSSAIDKFKLSNKMTHISTGGGASLYLFQGKKLPAIESIKKSKF